MPETAVEAGCAQALHLYLGTEEHAGAVCGVQKVSKHSRGKTNLEADLHEQQGNSQGIHVTEKYEFGQIFLHFSPSCQP